MQLRTFVWRIGSLTGTSDKLQFVMVPTKGSSRKYNEVFPDRAKCKPQRLVDLLCHRILECRLIQS